MKEQSQAPDLQERELVPEREYQRVTISGEEKCGVGRSGETEERTDLLAQTVSSVAFLTIKSHVPSQNTFFVYSAVPSFIIYIIY